MKTKLCSVLLLIFAVICLVGCNGNQSGSSQEEPINYYDDSYKEANKIYKIDGKNTLSLAESEKEITIENENMRIILSRANGSVHELANKQTGVYLIKNSQNDIPLMLEYVNGQFEYNSSSTTYTKFSNETEVGVIFTWNFAHSLQVISKIALQEHGNEISFSLDLLNNKQTNSVYYIEYPYLSDVQELYKPETDKFFHTYANGFVFNNPITNFNRTDFNGIRWYMGLYPYGFGSTMQFMSYYVQNYGGFHIQTYDSGYSIKSFLATGTGKSMHMGIRHYLDDICDGDKSFYKIGISNLVRGNWQESCEKYELFAKDTPWSKKAGLLENKTQAKKEFFEKTTFCNFAPHLGYASRSWSEWDDIYKVYKDALGDARILNIIGNDWQRANSQTQMNGEMDSFFPAVVNSEFYQQMKEKDYTTFFEFNNMYNVNATTSETFSLRNWQTTKDRYGAPQALIDSVDPSISWWYMCPEESWLEFSKEKTSHFVDEYDVDTLYHDCGYCVAPRTCFDTSHAHGTRVNIIPDEIAFLDALKEEYNLPIGEELISEVFVGTVDYYQARGNAGPMSFMDINDIRMVVEDNTAVKVSAFDYVYHQYGIIRTDGFMKPLRESGDMYYPIMAFTALNGGIPQFNYEYIKASFNVNEIQVEMINFLKKLSDLKLNKGKNYLTYGKMKKAPDTGAGQIKYKYLNTSTVSTSVIFSGEYWVDKVITSAFSYKDKTAIFLSNITMEELSPAFILNAGVNYGIDNGIVSLNGEVIAKIVDGIAKIKLDLPSRDVLFLELSSN